MLFYLKIKVIGIYIYIRYICIYIRVRGLLNGLLHPWAWRTGARHGQNLVDVHVVRRAPPVFMNKMPLRSPGGRVPPVRPNIRGLL